MTTPRFRFVSPLPVLFIVIALSLSSSFAQERNSGADIGARNRDFDVRSNNMRLLSERDPKANPRAEPNPAKALAQAREDFLQLQVSTKELRAAVIAPEALDLHFVGNSVEEINKRAERLNLALKLPVNEEREAKTPPKPASSVQNLRSSLLYLTRVVQTFVTSPAFKTATVVNTEAAAKAHDDLEEIIELSKQLRKDAEKLKKVTRKP